MRADVIFFGFFDDFELDSSPYWHSRYVDGQQRAFYDKLVFIWLNFTKSIFIFTKNYYLSTSKKGNNKKNGPNIFGIIKCAPHMKNKIKSL